MPRNPDGSITISTIGDFIDEGYDLFANCSDCGRRTLLPLEKLAERLGRDHGALVGQLGRKLSCSRCGSKNMTFTVVPHGTWDGSGGHSLSGKD